MAVIIEDVINGQTRRLDELMRMFLELFPQYAVTIERLKIKAHLPANSNPHFIAHQWLVDVDGQAAAMTSFKYSPMRDLGLTVYIAIRPAFRGMKMDGMHFSEWLLQASMEQIKSDAIKLARSAPSGLCLEVEPARLLARYRQFGFEEFPLEYYEPLFSTARKELSIEDFTQVRFQRRYLGYFPLAEAKNEPATPDLLNRVIMMLYKDHYGINENHPVFQRILTSIRKMTLKGEN